MRLKYVNTNPSTGIKLPKLEPKVKDPIRYPAIIEPIEKDFTDGYQEMLDTMNKMISVEIMKQIKDI